MKYLQRNLEMTTNYSPSISWRKAPSWYAIELRKEFGIDDTESIDLKNILETLNIRLKRKQFRGKMIGACKSVGMNRLIVISDKLKGTRERFTIAHELGHLIIHYGVHYCNSDDIKMYITTKTKEAEANSFAAELLLPESVVLRKIRTVDISIELAMSLSKKYDISITATMLRLVDLCDDQITFFYQIDGAVKWNYSSQDNVHTPICGKVIVGSLAHQVSAAKTKLTGYVDTDLWFTDMENSDIKCYEESVHWPQHSLTLTMVRIEES